MSEPLRQQERHLVFGRQKSDSLIGARERVLQERVDLHAFNCRSGQTALPESGGVEAFDVSGALLGIPATVTM